MAAAPAVRISEESRKVSPMDPLAHASVALIARPVAPRAHLPVLIVATQLPDLLFFVFEAAGIEHQAVSHMDFRRGLTYSKPARLPWSHGLLMCLGWSAAATLLAAAGYRDQRTGVVVGSVVLSHWLLDAIVYNNLPVAFDDSRTLGLGLITTGPGVIAGIALEVSLVATGISAYLVKKAAGRCR
jgi:hypothetical protein